MSTNGTLLWPLKMTTVNISYCCSLFCWRWRFLSWLKNFAYDCLFPFSPSPKAHVRSLRLVFHAHRVTTDHRRNFCSGFDVIKLRSGARRSPRNMYIRDKLLARITLPSFLVHLSVIWTDVKGRLNTNYRYHYTPQRHWLWDNLYPRHFLWRTP